MSPARLSKLETAMRIVLAYNEAFNRHDINGIMELLSDECVFEESTPAPDGSAYKGKDEIRNFLQDYLRGSPEAHFEIEEVFGMGERCIMRWKAKGEGTGEEKEYVRGVDIFRVRGGSICEKLSYVKG